MVPIFYIGATKKKIGKQGQQTSYLPDKLLSLEIVQKAFTLGLVLLWPNDFYCNKFYVLTHFFCRSVTNEEIIESHYQIQIKHNNKFIYRIYFITWDSLYIA